MSMAKHRPSVIDALDLAPIEPAKPPTPARAEVEAANKAAKARAVQHTSVYIPRVAYDRLREIAFHERKKIHDVIMEGVDLAIAARGHSESARKSTTAS
jgi:hypothetical protein